MKKLAAVLFSIMTLVMMVPFANAALVVVADGDTFVPDASDTYAFVGVLSDSNPRLTYGAVVSPGGFVMPWSVTAPDEFSVIARLTTGPNFTGTGIISYGGLNIINPGVTRAFPADGNFFTGFTQWLSIEVGTEALAIINEQFGGNYDVAAAGLFAGTTGLADVSTIDGGTGGAGGTGGGSSTVGEPGTIALLGLALVFFSGLGRKKAG